MIDERIKEKLDELRLFRRELHKHPELMYDLPRTADRVELALKAAGVDEVHTGIAGPGIVALIRGRETSSGRSIALRADMDALPINETTGKEYASSSVGQMHACGHDGHMAMLVGAAIGLADKRNFNGTVVLVFQPAEEGGAGAAAMIEDGLFDRWPVDEIYGMHNRPGLSIGEFSIAAGPFMASVDKFEIAVKGVGGHAGRPHDTTDPMIPMANLIQAIQTIVARNVDPIKAAVISITMVHGGDAFNVIPAEVVITGTVRTLDESVRDLVERRLNEIAIGIGQSFGCTVDLTYNRNYPVLINHETETKYAVQAATEVVGRNKVNINGEKSMGGEDFSFMLQMVPGAYINIGNGSSAGLHHPNYDFDDEAIEWGASYWMAIVRQRLPLQV